MAGGGYRLISGYAVPVPSTNRYRGTMLPDGADIHVDSRGGKRKEDDKRILQEASAPEQASTDHEVRSNPVEPYC